MFVSANLRFKVWYTVTPFKLGCSVNQFTRSWRRSVSYRNQTIDFLCKSMGWFLRDKDLRHERVCGMCIWLLFQTFKMTLGLYHYSYQCPWAFNHCRPLHWVDSSDSCLKLVSAIFYQIFISHQMIALQKLWKMFFISSKKLFSFLRYSNFCISTFPSFSPCQPLLLRLIEDKSQSLWSHQLSK